MKKNDEKIEIKTGIIEKSLFEEKEAYMIIKVGNEKIWVEGPVSSFENGNYSEGTMVEMKIKEFGTIVGDCEWGDIGILPLFIAKNVRIIK